MAKTAELLSGGIVLLINTIFIGMYVLLGGPLFGSLYSFLSKTNVPADGAISLATVQWIPSFFFMALIIIEIVLVIRLGYIVVSSTDYQGETEW